MKKILMPLMLITTLGNFTYAQYEEAPEYQEEQEAYYPEDNYEAEMFIQNQEDMSYPPIDDYQENYLTEEEVFYEQERYTE